MLDRETLTAAPHKTTADLLGSAPGVYVSSPEGEAVGHEIFLRGFNAEHGQDLELSAGALPVNQPSHLHGQGYSDLGFILPEAVRSIRVTEGVYDPRQGDFAVAGSVHFDLGVAERGILSKTSFGSFGQFRQLLLWAPKDEPEETFAAVSFQRTDGFGANRGSQSGTALGQLAFGGPLETKGLLLLSAHGARGNLAGVLRRDDVQAGRVDFYGSYPDPGASSQSAFNSRYAAAVTLERLTDAGAKTKAALWAQLIDFRGRFDFTGYLERSRQNPDWVGRGDLTEQANQDTGLGLSLTHRPARVRMGDWGNAGFELGAIARTNGIEQKQFLLTAPQNETWDIRTDAAIRMSDLGAYVDVDAQLGRYLHLRGGLRADVLYANMDDRLGNFIPSFQRETHIVGYRRSALGLAVGPRATLEVTPWTWLTLLASYGEGYRSPQALQLEEGENAPYAKVHALEAGARFKTDRSALTVAAYRTTLSTDLAFDPGEASLTRVGPTLRQGVAAHLVTRPWDWLLGSFSATYVHATLTSPPAATVDNPNPPFQLGQLLPYVPPLVLRGDLGTEHSIRVADSPLKLRAGIGGSYLSSRPLPYAQFAAPFFLLDASASARWRWVELSVEVFNVLNSRYAASEYSFVSDWNNREAPSLIPARHFSAGAPRTVVGSLTLHF
ncbi:MAG: TonB-dependent receptor [Myxococcaceae bacterium]